MANVLEKIVTDKAIELEERKQQRPLSSFIDTVKPSTRSFYQALRRTDNGGTHFILECKKASPSKGLIRAHFDLDEITAVYKNYATCISVLTDEKYFQGSFDYLQTVRNNVEQPLIGKDFYIDEYQVYFARLHGADAILLMLSVLSNQEYKKLAQVAQSLNMSILTEVSNETEVHRALELDAQIIGINNRDLRDLSTNLATTEKLRALIPQDKIVISESGIYTHDDVKRLSPLCNGFLVGSSIMAQNDMEQACRKLILGENKVCGLTRCDDAIAAYNAGAVFGGLIFYSKSPRFVDLDCAKAIVDSAPLSFVGVFVNASIEHVVEYAHQLKLNVVQLHGSESADYITKLKNKLPKSCKIWQAFAIKNELPPVTKNIDRYLFDTHSDSLPGGTGQVFDWTLLKDFNNSYMLAGGLNSDNIQQASLIGATGLDINSGVETEPGKKSTDKINDVFKKLRQY
ncbi:bifunctional indole-3-glycerol-phosphate synthase TrpC/phosphoribosylanthranilate isomerase TrpF [Pseudoalteromonas denitrificans]|uniref:Multifunctional fusion protein n=1 Tax=Pseudoalteromonas denitrificans DSM 6059 TaxID=1123010 RepID=A0A1I1QUS8_9GAMM|nr:bifunctional indole-3-glycerol-phosphate synthase TrpC/phosphoribosylanthranilate isomerase TrpF [Pseudoalteromonas denitrificans]SFD25747.1 indole-3-glycerol phosphate synthase [Pseudoalteromonas denitrificans DSM 6059]